MRRVTWTLGLALSLLGCRSGSSKETSSSGEVGEGAEDTGFDDEWWADSDEEDGDGDSEGEGEGEDDWPDEDDFEEEESFWYGYLEDGSAEETVGEVGWFTEGCAWFAEASGRATEACPGCSVAFVIEVGEAYVEEDVDCDGVIEEIADREHTVGFGGESAWIYLPEDGSWEEFAVAFYEGSAIGWFDEL